MRTKKKNAFKKVALGGQKGGPGKTTLALSFAEWLELHLSPFRLLNGNPGQQSLVRLSELREANGIQPAMPVQNTFEIVQGPKGEQHLRDRAASLLQAPFEGVTLLDLPGWIDEKVMPPALLHCDILVIPLPPNCLEYLSLAEVVTLLQATQKLRQGHTAPLETWIVFNRCKRSKGQESLKAKIRAEAPGLGLKVCRQELTDLNDHFDAQLVGRSAISFAPSSKAAQQIDAVAQEIGL